jgi:hypothetical protein
LGEQEPGRAFPPTLPARARPDPAARRALGDKLRARYASVYDLDAGGPSLRQAALRALALFRERAVRPASPDFSLRR